MDDQRYTTTTTKWVYVHGTGVKPLTPLKLSRRSQLRYRWTMATERFRRSLARRIYDFEDGW
jgi:hypothetical protein